MKEQGLDTLRGLDLNQRPLGYEPEGQLVNPVDSVAIAPQSGEAPAKTVGIYYPTFAPPRFDMRAYQREWFAANGPCVRCGSERALHLHHKDPSTKLSHKIWSWSLPRREAELAKCEVLCSDCHEAHHGKTRSKHGVSGYKRGCRCEVCRTAKRLKRRRERDNQLERQFVSSPTTQYGLTGPSLIERQREMRERLGK